MPESLLKYLPKDPERHTKSLRRIVLNSQFSAVPSLFLFYSQTLFWAKLLLDVLNKYLRYAICSYKIHPGHLDY